MQQHNAKHAYVVRRPLVTTDELIEIQNAALVSNIKISDPHLICFSFFSKNIFFDFFFLTRPSAHARGSSLRNHFAFLLHDLVPCITDHTLPHSQKPEEVCLCWVVGQQLENLGVDLILAHLCVAHAPICAPHALTHAAPSHHAHQDSKVKQRDLCKNAMATIGEPVFLCIFQLVKAFTNESHHHHYQQENERAVRTSLPRKRRSIITIIMPLIRNTSKLSTRGEMRGSSSFKALSPRWLSCVLVQILILLAVYILLAHHHHHYQSPSSTT